MPATTASVHIQAPPADVMAVLIEHERYPELFPHIQGVAVEQIDADTWDVEYVTRVIRDLRYTLRLTRDGDSMLSWTQLDGVFLRNEGHWRLSGTDTGTRVDYLLDIELAVFLPHAIARSLTEHALPRLLAQVKAEVERRAQPAS